MAVVANKAKRPCLGHVDLHPNQAVCVARQMMQGDALAKVHRLIVEGFPISASLAKSGKSALGSYNESFR
jgi:hypothetical protein